MTSFGQALKFVAISIGFFFLLLSSNTAFATVDYSQLDYLIGSTSNGSSNDLSDPTFTYMGIVFDPVVSAEFDTVAICHYDAAMNGTWQLKVYQRASSSNSLVGATLLGTSDQEFNSSDYNAMETCNPYGQKHVTYTFSNPVSYSAGEHYAFVLEGGDATDGGFQWSYNSLDTVAITGWYNSDKSSFWHNGGGTRFSLGITVETPPTCTENCYSNVLFLPGLEASRLYDIRENGSEDQLWEPNANSDVEDLYLDTDGESINPDIYTRDIVDAGQGIKKIYKSFSETMDQLVAEQKINAWKPYAYDWRQDVNDIVNNGTKYQDGVVSLVDTLQSLAGTASKNGKVTIVTHSNGGLLAKALLKKLQDDKDAGANNLIDNVDVLIMVGAPQIGTASAVPAIMHGYDQQFLLGLLMDNTHARELGRNMPGAYALLPSREYINRVSASPTTFVDNVIPSGVTTNLVQTFGSAIDSYAEYKDFLFGAEGRTNPAPSQTNLPISLLPNLFSQAESLHDAIDAWTPPESLRVIEIAGWGIDTIASFEYYPVCENSASLGCTYVLDERPRFTLDGDKTVVTPSAHYVSFLGNAEKYWLNIKQYNKNTLSLSTKSHANILEVSPLLGFISNTIQNTTFSSEYLYDTKPIDTSNRIRLSIHSPATLDAYDSNGNHTGKICTSGSDFCSIEDDIPNSLYIEFGEGKYLNIPNDGQKDIKINGLGTGTFTFNVEEFQGDTFVANTVFKDIPVTPDTKVEIDIEDDLSSLSQMHIDMDGNGTVDFNLTPKINGVVTMPIYTFSGFLQPINDTAHQIGQDLSVFKAGSTIPVKFQLKKWDGTVIQASTAPIWLTPQRGSKMNVPIDESVYNLPAMAGNEFKWDSVSQQYIYNWSTKGLTAGYWYKIFVKLDDGNVYSVTVGLK